MKPSESTWPANKYKGRSLISGRACLCLAVGATFAAR